MKKTDKKIISIFLILIILVSQVMPVIVNAETAENKAVTLEEYLIANGVDENEDEKISDEEWKLVKNLKFVGGVISDFTGLEKAVNLKNLTIHNLNPKLIDFSKLVSLENLDIECWGPDCKAFERTDLNLTALKNLDTLYIMTENLNNIDLSNLENLTNIVVDDLSSTVKFSNSQEYVWATFKVKDINADFSNKKGGYINIENSNWDNVKLPKHVIVENGWFENEKNCYFSSDDEEIYLIKDGEIEYGVSNIVSKDNNIVEIKKEEYEQDFWRTEFIVLGKNVGRTEIVITDAIGREITKKVEVIENDYEEDNDNVVEKEEEKEEIDKTLENTGVTAEFCNDENIILKSNGQLWEVYSWREEAEIIDTNVKKYISESIYVNQFNDVTYRTENTLYNNGKLKVISYYDGADIEFNDVIDVEGNVFLKSNGDLYAVRYSYVTEKFYKEELITNNVKKVVGDFIVKDDDSLWFSKKTNSFYYNHLKQYKKIGTQDIKFQFKYSNSFVDSSDIIWNYNDEENELKWTKGEKYIKNNNKTSYNLILEDGKVYINEGWDYINNIYKRGELLLDNVSDIFDETIIRTDGTIWVFDDKELKKMKPSNPILEKDEYILSESIKNKEVEGNIAISGLKVGQTVENFLKENNFKEGCTVKIFDSENKEVESTEFIGTGTKIKLYEDGKQIREFVAVIYGDTTGDGKIEALDALNLIRAVNERITLKSEVYLEAGKVSGGEKATALDALTIVKSLNGKAEIKQDM